MNAQTSSDIFSDSLYFRKNWEKHPHYPSQVLLLGSHHGFQRISRYLIEEAKQGTAPRSLFFLYRRWIAGMRSHEAYEEHKLYPYLTRRWHVSFASSTEGHHELHRLDSAVRNAFKYWEEQDNGSQPLIEISEEEPNLVQALVDHDRVLNEHLQLEEDLVIPLLLALSPQEFTEYYQNSIEYLLQRLQEREHGKTYRRKMERIQ